MGDWVTMKINPKAGLLSSPYLVQSKKLFLKEALCQVASLDPTSRSAFVFLRDNINLQFISLWVPITSLKAIEYPLKYPGNSYPLNSLLGYHDELFKELVGTYSRKC